MNRLDATFARLTREGHIGLFPYVLAGYPTLDSTAGLIEACVVGGADGIELGVPFSDPLADGATIQHAGEIALANGASLRWALDLARHLRNNRALEIPIALMTYYNPIHHYGVDRFAAAAADSGIDGFIVPDLPSGEATALNAAAERHGQYVIEMVAPTATDERLAEVGRLAHGFVYCVSLVGTTGVRSDVSADLPAFMARVRRFVAQPLLIGFGIAGPQHVAAVRQHGDGVIVGTAIVNLLDAMERPQQAAALRDFVQSLRAACDGRESFVTQTQAD